MTFCLKCLLEKQSKLPSETFLFPPKVKNKSQKKTQSNHSQHAYGQWCGSKTFTSYVIIVSSALILALSALWPRSFPCRLLFFFESVLYLKKWLKSCTVSPLSQQVVQDTIGDQLCHWAVTVEGLAMWLALPIISLIIWICLLKRIAQLFFAFWCLSQRISWEKIICPPRCVSLFSYMTVYFRWHLITDVCEPRCFWSPSAWNPVTHWCFVEPSVVQPSGLYGQPVFRGRGENTQFHHHDSSLCNIHHRLLFRPYLMSTGAGFSIIIF